jgi:hypothetical protein
MAKSSKHPKPPADAAARRVRLPGAKRVVAGQTVASPNGTAASDVLLYVLGGNAAPHLHNVVRDFPLLNRRRGETDADHLVRVVQLVEEAMAAGGTHLVVPHEHANWLGDHPLVANYFAAQHVLAEATAETGIVFSFTPQPRQRVTFTAEVSGWEIVPGEGISLLARDSLVKPRLTLRPTTPARGLLKGHLAFAAEGLQTLRVSFTLSRSGQWLAQ